MIPLPEYDALSDIYEWWSLADPAAEATHTFYMKLCMSEPGQVAELGVGTGRIAIDIAYSGKSLTGIDISPRMLRICRERATRAGVSDRLTLIQSDVRDFTLATPAHLVTFPFRSIGHLLTSDDKLAAVSNVRKNLVSGGRLVFDHYIFDEAWARSRHRIPQLMCDISNENGTSTLVWDIYSFDFATQQMSCQIVTEKLDQSRKTVEKVYNPLTFSWILPEQMKDIALAAGFEVEAVYGDFDYGSFVSDSRQQVWVLRRT